MLFLTTKASIAGACLRSLLQYRKFAAGSPKFIVVHESRNEQQKDGSNYSCTITSGNHTIVSDLTPVAGGKDQGMSPKELLWSALGSCTAMTIRTYYKKSRSVALSNPATSSSGWAASQLDSIQVKVEEHGDHPHVPSGLSIEIELLGTLTAEQKAKLINISKNCPVKKIMTNNIAVDTSCVNL